MTLDTLDLAPLRTLVAIARHGTLTEAAHRLNLSQPAATHQIRRLERQLGVTLFERRGRGLALTEVGHTVLHRARRVLAEIDALGDDLLALSDLREGHLRIGGGTTAIVHLLPALIASFARRYPGISFYLKESPTTLISAAVASGELDLGIVTLPCPEPGLVAERWLDDPVVFVGRPDAPLVGRAIEASALEGQAFVHAAPGMPLRGLVEEALRVAGVAPRIVMELQSIEAIKATVEAGLGYTALGRRTLERELAEGRLAELTLPSFQLQRALGLVVRAQAPASPALVAFRDHLRAGARSEA